MLQMRSLQVQFVRHEFLNRRSEQALLSTGLHEEVCGALQCLQICNCAQRGTNKGLPDPRPGQRFPSTLLQVRGLLDGSRLAGEGKRVLANPEARALSEMQPEETGRE